MDASQYKDYVLAMLFIKYISDKYANVPFAAIKVPTGASFRDMSALKGRTDIGDQINKKIIEPLVAANNLGNMPDFADDVKLGSGKEQVDRLTNLIAIFENPRLDFSKNRAEGDDILGDAYEYLMRHFATESGKSKGQFYTPAEVSRIMARIIGITPENSHANTTAYDPTCGSGSLLLKVSEQSGKSISLYGQEKDATTSGLARMNFILHNNPSAKVMQGNTLADPKFRDGAGLKQFDYVVANPPFSDKRWSNGVDPLNDPFGRFEGFGFPPEKNGDFAYLLHIIRSVKRTGKAACILPHGVLFRGNAEEEIRRNLVRKGYLKAIIGLPANLFYGTGIPACILLLDKENATARKSIFMVDASKAFAKDGPKNRLREQDIHRIVDVVNREAEIPGYSARVSHQRIGENGYNLNIPRYIDSQEREDLQDIGAHLHGGIPAADIDALGHYWQVYPGLRETLFAPADRPGYLHLRVAPAAIRDTIFGHGEFTRYTTELETLFQAWRTDTTAYLKSLEAGCDPRAVIHHISEDLLQRYRGKPLLDAYDVYQHLMTYWAETMQDDLYIIAADGWKAETYRILAETKQKKTVDKGWDCDLVPKALVANRYFPEDVMAIGKLENHMERLTAERTELEEEQGGEEGLLGALDKLNTAHAKVRLRELEGEKEAGEERACLRQFLQLLEDEATTKKQLREAEAVLDTRLYAKYPGLTTEEVKTLVVDDKWMYTMQLTLQAEMEQISQRLAQRIRTLSERYEKPLPQLEQELHELEHRVKGHLEKMGFVW